MTLSVTIKTLQQKQFKVDVEPSDTVAQLKEKIQATNGAPVANQKLVYSGKILTDEKTVGECNIKEKDFLVLMVAKPKAAAAPAASAAPASASSSTPAPTASVPPPSDQVPPAPVPAPAEPAIQPPAQSTATTTDATATSASAVEMPAFGDMSALVTGPALQASINNMVEMGFPKDQVLAAMRASFNNPDRAVDYLMNGIPEHLLAEASRGAQQSTGAPASQAPISQTPATPSAPTVQQQAPAQPGNLFQAAQQAAQQQGGAGPGRGLGGSAGGHQPIDLAALRDSPMMAQIRTMVQQNPALVGPLLQNLATANPQLAEAIAANPEAFMQLLGADAGAGEGAEDDGEGPIPPGAHAISVTPEERDAIQRLEALGFSRQAAIEAYLACDKNEELAANYLFENGFED